MESLAFYSYKGGVGRTLLVANTARFLALLGKRVVAVDLDLDAPGLHYKLRAKAEGSPGEGASEGGVVPFLLAADIGTAPELSAHLTEVPLPPDADGEILLMAAGPAPSASYWADAAQLKHTMRLERDDGQALPPLLELRARLEEEIAPDYLLIDARTGVSEIGSLATTLIADTVVLLALPTEESLAGTVAVAEGLKRAPRLDGQGPVRVVPVLSRGEAGDSSDPLIERLLSVTDPVTIDRPGRPVLPSLPHDDRVAEDRVLIGAREASAFGDLYEAYLRLFTHLFPDGVSRAESVTKRLAAVASVRQELTERWEPLHGTFALAPWSDLEIAEGVQVGSGWSARYADLACYLDADNPDPVMVVEYIGDTGSPEVLPKWRYVSDNLRCVVLIRDAREREVYARPQWSDAPFTLSESGWWLPRPRDFRELADVGDRSLGSLLAAYRAGHPTYLSRLVDEWTHSTAVTPHGGTPWRPDVAREILNGLAAPDDPDVAVYALYSTAPDRYSRPYRGMMESGAEIERWVEKDLFAPLYWRVPVEAAFRYATSGPARPCLAGHRLLAEEIMGLQFDPDRQFREESLKVWRDLEGPGDGDSEIPARQLGKHWRMEPRYAMHDPDLPPALAAWALDGIDGPRAGSRPMKQRLHNLVQMGRLSVNGLLGTYQPDTAELNLYAGLIDHVAKLVEVSPRRLKSVAFIHLSVLAYAHLARDLDGRPGLGFASPPATGPFAAGNDGHVVIAQYFTMRLIHRLEDPDLSAAFERLSDHLAPPYRRWRDMQAVPVEQMRSVLMRARAAEWTLGFPDHGTPT